MIGLKEKSRDLHEEWELKKTAEISAIETRHNSLIQSLNQMHLEEITSIKER